MDGVSPKKENLSNGRCEKEAQMKTPPHSFTTRRREASVSTMARNYFQALQKKAAEPASVSSRHSPSPTLQHDLHAFALPLTELPAGSAPHGNKMSKRAME